MIIIFINPKNFGKIFAGFVTKLKAGAVTLPKS